MTSLSFSNATQIIDNSNSHIYDEFVEHLLLSSNNEYDTAIKDITNSLTPSRIVYERSFTSNDVGPIFVTTHQPSSDEFVKSIIINIYIEKIIHNGVNNNVITAPFNWIFFLIDYVEILLNGQQLIYLNGQALEGLLHNYINTNLKEYI